MDDKITVIVPVYNVENYLRKCLDSIITQTYKNIEIVVVNDGSTDASGEICKEFSEMDHRILYIEQENAGLSAARNTGLNNMSGNYVTFVDSDDWIEQDYVETLYKKIVEYQADIAVGNYYSFNESEGMFYFHILGDSYYEKVYDNVSIFENLYETQEMKSFALISAWGKLYKARLFEQLRFDIGKLGEDGYLNQKVYLLSEKVIYLNKSLYAYRIRKGSLSRVWTEKWMHALVDAMSERITLLANMGYPLEKHLAVYRQMLEVSLANGQASGLSDTAKKNHLVGDALILTVSDQIEELDYLLESLPNICFYIAAPVQFSEKIRSLETNYNVRLRTITNEEQLNFLVDTCDFLLDINHFQEVDAIVSKFVQAGKSVFAFDNTVHGNQGQEVFLSSTPDKLVSRVRDYLNEVRVGTNHQEKIIQDGTWNVFKIDDKAHFIVGANVICRNFENFHVSSGKLILHDGVFINNSCSFNCMERIEIGAGTMMGEGVRFYDHDHIYTAEKIEKWQWTTAPIRVGRDCWIGSNVTILKGVTIGDNTIIGAGCLIRNDIPSNSVVYNNGNLFVKRRD